MRQETSHTYQKELFARLKKSISLKREEECFDCLLSPARWFIIEKAHPKACDVEKTVAGTCQCLNNSRKKIRRCARVLGEAVKRATQDKKAVRYACAEGLHGFVYPIIQGDKIYGYIGACYRKKDVQSSLLDVFAAFTDTIVREVQKELELSKLYETLRPRAIALSTVHTVHRLMSSTLDLDELLPRIARLSLQVMRCNRCSIKLVDSRRKVLLPKVTVDLRSKKVLLKKVKVGMYAPGKAVKYERPIRGRDYLAMPLIEEDVIGVITLYDKIDNKPFTQFDQEIMSTMGEQAVIAIRNAQLYEEQENLTIGSIKALSKVLDTRAPGTFVPRASFLKICIMMGQELKMTGDDMKSLEYAAILHDAGQVIVPEEVLSKPAKLTGKEYDKVKEHPMAGVEIIRHMKALKSVTPIILYHHENYDGTGYPKGLKKEQIPLGARILALVSAFEAMITKRPYRATPRTVDESIEEIGRNSGTQFDPKVVDAFMKAIKRKDIRAMLERELYGNK
jgi:HD-GYP domain-containing protein (c-di-GMP phosphodiesterase class II)